MLLSLPSSQIIHTILVYSRAGSSLNLCSRSLHALLRSAPNIVRARYLLASWHDEYELYPTDNRLSPPKFISVLPKKKPDEPSPMYVLEYCLRFPLCNVVALGFVQDQVLKLPVFGNYRLAHEKVSMSSSLASSRLGKRRRSEGEEEGEWKALQEDRKPNDEGGLSEASAARRTFLPLSELPKRLFKNFDVQSTTYPVGQDISIEEDAYAPLRRHLLSFGPLADFPPLADLLLLLRILLLHPHSTDSPIRQHSTSAVNSHSGYPLTKAVFSKSTSFVALLLATGADVTAKGKLPLVVAGRSNWVEGLKLMVERDEEELTRRRKALDAITAWLLDQPTAARTTNNFLGEGGDDHNGQSLGNAEGSAPAALTNTTTTGKVPASSKTKRRRLSDRVPLEPRLLYEAVKAEAVQVTDYLMNQKGVAPDMKTIRALDRLSAKGRGV